MKIENLLGIILAGAIILGTFECEKKRPKMLEERTDSEITSIDRKSEIIGEMSEFENINLPLNHADPNLLQDYKINYNAPWLIGKIIKVEFGYFKNNKFLKCQRFYASHIQKPEDIFSAFFYQWKIEIRKPKEMRDKDFSKNYAEGFKLNQEVLDGNKKIISSSNLYVFPVEDYGGTYQALSQKIIPVWNKNINGQYKNLEIVKDPNNKPLDYLYLIQGVKKESRFKKPENPRKP